MWTYSRQYTAFLRCHLLGKDCSPTFPSHCWYCGGECKVVLLHSQQGLNRQLSWKDEHHVVTKKFWKTPGQFTCRICLTENILGNITKCFNYPSFLVEIKCIFLSTWFCSHTCTKVEQQIPTRKQNTNKNCLLINSLPMWQQKLWLEDHGTYWNHKYFQMSPYSV